MRSHRLLALLLAGSFFVATAFAQNLAGAWTASIETQIGVQEYTFEFKIEGTTLTGTASSANGENSIEEGAIDGNTITFIENLTYQGMPLRIAYTGTLEGEEIRFSRDVAGLAMETFVATRPEE